MSKARLLAVGEMLFATAIWGFGFTATVWAMYSFSPFATSLARFFGAFLLTLPFLPVSPLFRAEFNWRNCRLSCVPGLLIGGVLILQTWGLEYTTATKSGFITTLYVVLVPVIEVLVIRKKLHYSHALWVFLALVGTALIVDFSLARQTINKGDMLTFLCAILAALHIVVLGKISPKVKSAFIFNAFQSFWAGALSLFSMLLATGPHWRGYSGMAMLGLLSLTLGSTMIAFALQVKAQRTLSPSLSSLLFLLESPFAMFFSILLLGERLSATQIAGAVLIIAAAFGAVHFERKVPR